MLAVDDPTLTALVDLLTKGGGTFAGAIAAMAIVWRYAIAPLSNRILDLHAKMATDVATALERHAASLDRIGERLARMELRLERVVSVASREDAREPTS